jgi:hypothetical protein
MLSPFFSWAVFAESNAFSLGAKTDRLPAKVLGSSPNPRYESSFKPGIIYF